MATLSLAMIVKNEGSTIERVLSCAKAFADEIIVVDTGSTDDTVAKAKAMGAEVHHFEWIQDFAAARNFSFSHCTKDWIIWLDGDDIITPDNQKKIANLKTTVLGEGIEAVYLRYIYPPFIQWRERMVRRELWGNRFEWREPIHECIHGINNDNARFFDDIFIQHDTPHERHAQKKDRNITILRKHYENGARDERTMFIYAVECLHSVYKEEGEKILAEFFTIVKSKEYRYEIYSKMYNFYMHFGEPERALDALTKAIATDPARAEAYYKLGRHVMGEKNDRPHEAIPLLTTASQINVPSYGTPETEAYSFGPWDGLCTAYFRLGNFEKAKEFALKAIQKNSPRREWLSHFIAYDTLNFPPVYLPPEWQEWVEGNLNNRVPRACIMRILEENNFPPAHIITGLRIFDAKQAP